LQDVQWAVGNSRGARKLTRTPHVNQKKKKLIVIILVRVVGAIYIDNKGCSVWTAMWG
jgi:hypothetical protein